VLAVGVSLFGVGSSEAQAQGRGRVWRGPVPSSTYWYNQPNFNAYPWNYLATLPGNYGYMTPAPDYYYGWPSVSYSYTLPSYQYYYNPGFGGYYYYNPGSYFYWRR
jgi:hypothetical protein